MVSNGKRQTDDAPNHWRFFMRWRKPYQKLESTPAKPQEMWLLSCLTFCKWARSPFSAKDGLTIHLRPLYVWIVVIMSADIYGISYYIKAVLRWTSALRMDSLTSIICINDRHYCRSILSKVCVSGALQFQNSRIRTNKSCSSGV